MIEFTHETTRYKVKPENAQAIRALAAKPPKIKNKIDRKHDATRRDYPIFEAGMTTEDYLKCYAALNSRLLLSSWAYNYNLRAAHHHANPYRIEFRDGFSIDQRELWIEHLRRASDVVTLAWTAAGETSPTIPIEKRLIALDSLRRICKHVLSYATTDTAVRATLAEIEDPRGEYKSLMLDYQRTLETPQYRHLSGPRSLARL